MKHIRNPRILGMILVLVVLTTCMLHVFVFRTRRTAMSKACDEDVMNSSEQIRCILYDKPPRTGSTTIGYSLSRCLRAKGYSQQPYPKGISLSKRKASQVQMMLKLKSKRRASVKRHAYIREEDIKLIRTQCHKFLYITSAAPIKERMWSGIKHLLAKRHGSITRDSLDMVEARELLQELLRNQSFEKGRLRSLAELNAYPYLTEDSDVAVVKEKMIPDYVIRKEFLRQDLQPLLQAFGCQQSFMTKNVHEDSVRSVDEVFFGLRIPKNDGLYESLCQVAEMNNVGTLKRVKDFIHNNETSKQTVSL